MGIPILAFSWSGSKKRIKKKKKTYLVNFKKKVWLQNEVAFAETSDLSDPQITLEETNKTNTNRQ